ncbi:MAG: class I SAM-dependent methyltransferase [Actinomycetota bacterium]
MSSTTTRWRQQNCVFCEEAETKVALTRPDYEVRRCLQCQVMWTDPLRFHDDFNASEESVYLSVDDTIRSENTRRLETLMRFVTPDSHPSAVEIGCMHGNFVAQMREAGFGARGLDLSSSAVEAAETLNPGCVSYGTLDESIPDGSLDVVAAFNVIEHMDRPDAFLDDVERVLRPGGVLILETPQQEGLYHKVSFLRGRLQRGTTGVEVGVHPGTHIFKFGRKAWRNILGRRPFEIEATRPTSTPLSELLAKKKNQGFVTRSMIIGVGLAARATRLDNRVVVVARRH